ncbi:phosphoenolpyruvate carboxykinase (ATP) [Ornithinibacillus californiensis]|uniref:aldolase n=1 Tax=Ornithinibacillus californiensis TaxID=161536 RepID=UPI000A4F1AB8|nr:aldolase [Ornithinibacillus californiensis]
MSIKALKRTLYKAFGLSILSDAILPELQKGEGSSTAEVYIKIEDLSRLWSITAEPNRYFTVKEDFCMFEIPNVAIYMVEKGSTITISPMPGAKEDQIRLYLLGTCMGALLFQRKVLPLHGSAVVIDGKAYAIVGDSGAGKSTLASAFLQRGYQLLTDDIVPVTLSDDGYPMVIPGYPQQKLWIESLNHFGMNSKHLRPIIDREDKYAISVRNQFISSQVPLAGVLELTKGDCNAIQVTPISKLERLHKLYYHTYRNFLVPRSGLMEWHFHLTTTIARKLDFYQIERPSSRFTAFEIVDLLLEYQKRSEPNDTNHF